jgi:hypothetical protein
MGKKQDPPPRMNIVRGASEVIRALMESQA